MAKQATILFSTFCLFIFAINLVHAQKYERTTLILSSGDTLIGKVSQVYPRYTAKEIKFKTYKSLSFDTYEANQIQSVSSDRISLYTNKVSGEKLLMSLEVIGNLSLYQTYTSKGLKRFFIKESNGEIIEITPDNYIEVLQKLVTPCDEKDYLFYKNKIKYNSKDLSNFISKYNACILPNKYVETDYSTKYAVTIQISAGMQINSFIENPNFTYTSNISFAPGVSLRTFSDRKINFGSELYWVTNQVTVITGLTLFDREVRKTNYKSLVSWFNPYIIFESTPKISFILGPKIGFINYGSAASGLNTGFSAGINLEILPRVSFQTEYQYTNNKVERNEFQILGQEQMFNATGQLRFKLTYNLIY